MSFIYQDKHLIEKLLNSALDFESRFTKQGQDAAAATEQARSALLTQLTDLQNQLSQNAAPTDTTQVAHQGGSDQRQSLGSSQLESLGDLIKWLATSQIVINGKRIAFDTDPNDDAYTPYQLETHTATPAQRGQAPGRFFVNPDLLKQYLVSLQAYESQHNNIPMQVQLRALVQDANQELGLEVSQNYKAPEKALPDATVLDSLPKILNTAGTYITGPATLTYGDTKTLQDFNAWLQKEGISLWDEANQRKLTLNQKEFSIPAVLGVILERAKFLASRAVPATKDTLDIYVRQMTQLSSQSGGTSPESAQTGGTNAPSSTDQSGSASGISQNITNEIIDTLPLSLSNIDFSRIYAFFDKIAPLMSNNPTVIGYINNTKNLMKQASALTENGDTNFQLGIAPEAVVNMLKDPHIPGRFKGSNFFALVKLLDQIVDNVRAVVGYFASQYNSKLLAPARAYIFGQIGQRPDTPSIYSRNIDSLKEWLSVPVTTR
jgi:hypothetical protein